MRGSLIYLRWRQDPGVSMSKTHVLRATLCYSLPLFFSFPQGEMPLYLFSSSLHLSMLLNSAVWRYPERVWRGRLAIRSVRCWNQRGKQSQRPWRAGSIWAVLSRTWLASRCGEALIDLIQSWWGCVWRVQKAFPWEGGWSHLTEQRA